MANIYEEKNEPLHLLLEHARSGDGATVLIPDLQRPCYEGNGGKDEERRWIDCDWKVEAGVWRMGVPRSLGSGVRG